MIVQKKYAAIDIGSNAVRLLISTITEQEGRDPMFKKTSLVRVPIRLGADVFLSKAISEENIRRMIDTMQAFKLLMRSHKIEKFRACATSAMRESENGEAVAQKIKELTGIEIDIIDGKDEAAIIAATDLHALIQTDKTYLYVDVGGGSTEFTLYSNGKTITSRSFKLGTVRLLNKMVPESVWNEVEDWIKKVTKEYTKIDLIGSGGNINNIFKSSGKANGKPLSFLYLSSYYQLLQSLTYEERITELNLNQDRADVIVPAAKIYLSAMKWTRARRIYVPKIGLSDGIIRSLYQESKEEASRA
ncbi:exopolyphosphatase / guanosine-5'-triphosphate,3'-diphosphate pyrophosphatase [Salinimicrobium catena]|uniref:Exopolyphosphatase / guanosine-5'-triphosphate,3'-diphosphate pyrophosphatase n=1 Tax=Salinimicrobium catena TaxID=390640 RepID=A0A1H5KTZ5_9FLAO|nr:rod shape-determining protein [Salinimicrobium catena]SDL01803.1 exopolyphosphatase / guanosine-5'-triphosphate,3'-diphosphate pyrophosphatase [Salinimicrobium catena]SEE68329.1 exopolyphosphatase / guanosine-5'-triphosphate,3'-diphosphate pyrophosphatase [Salinimicrobium catena]